MPRPRINKNWLFLGLAVALGVGAIYFSNSLLQQRMKDLEAESHKGERMTKVIVASHDLKVGDALTEHDLAVRSVPEQWVHSTALRPDDFEDVRHQRLASPLKRGETLLQSHLEGKGTQVFSATLQKGWRALTFEVDDVNSISGMLRPGDRIDLIYTGKPPSKGIADALNPAAGEDVTLPLLSNVRVLATGTSVTKRDAQGQNKDFPTITLEVSPLDADRVIVAKAGGHVTALLREPQDGARNDTRPLTPDSLVAGSTGGAGRYVEYIVGGNGGGVASTMQLAQGGTGTAVH
jgi:pilus assembly protein CpaB